MTNEEVIAEGGGSPQARMSGPEAVRNAEDEVCPLCHGIKPWDCEECDSCYDKKQKQE